MRRIRELEDAHPDAQPLIAGGLASLIEQEDEGEAGGFDP